MGGDRLREMDDMDGSACICEELRFGIWIVSFCSLLSPITRHCIEEVLLEVMRGYQQAISTVSGETSS